jgi:hypothetical protein
MFMVATLVVGPAISGDGFPGTPARDSAEHEDHHS